MHIEFDRDTCVGMFNCVKEWDKFVKDRDAGKATLLGSDEVRLDVNIRAVPPGEEFNAEMAARICPVDAITLYEDDD